jgi:C4-dicarboxylate transporter DctM subunit
MTVIISSVLILLLMFLGMPVTFSFLTGSLVYLWLAGMSMGSLVSDAYYALDKFALLAVPLFMIAGSLMEVSGIAEKLIDFSRALLKRIKGGMGAVIPVSSMFFGALSGSGTATVAALSAILVPRLQKLGWDKRYVAALLAASGPLGYMIPPNMNAILYGVVANASIAALFLATVVPGVLWGLLYIVINRIIYKKWCKDPGISDGLTASSGSASVSGRALGIVPNPAVDKGYFSDVYSTFRKAIPAFIMPVIIFGGIYGGVFTPTEAGAVACIYALLVGVLLYRMINWQNGLGAFAESGRTLGAILIILPMVHIFTRILVLEGVPQMVANAMMSISDNKYVIIFMIVLIMFIAGFFLDAGILIFIITPILIPTANAIQMDPIQLGVILFVAIGVGTLTPPMAMNLFVVSRISGVPMAAIIRPLMPFLLFAAIPILLLVAYVPEVSLWLPNLVMNR